MSTGVSTVSTVSTIKGQPPLQPQTYNGAATDAVAANLALAAAATSLAEDGEQAPTMSSAVYTTQVTLDTRDVADVSAVARSGLEAQRFMADSMAGEQSRLQKLDGKAKTGIHAVRQEYLYMAYMTHYYQFVSNIMIFTLLVTMLGFVFAGLWLSRRIGRRVMIVALGVMLFLYVLGIIVAFRNNEKRRKYEWSKRYWNKDAADMLDKK